MKSRYVIVVIIIVIIVLIAFFAGYVAAPKSALAPTASETVAKAPVKASPAALRVPEAETVTFRENASTSPSVSVEYPKFPSLPAQFNSAIKAAVDSRLKDFREQVGDNEEARQDTKSPGSSDIPMSTYTFLAKWQKAAISEKYVSFVVRFDSYVGGASTNEDIVTFNYDIAAQKELSLGDLFPNTPDYLKKISALARTRLVESLKAAGNGDVPTESINAGTEPDPDNFKNFTFTDSDLTLYFPKYSVAPGALGEQRAVIPRSAVK